MRRDSTHGQVIQSKYGRKIIVACEVLASELRAVLSSEWNVELVWVPAALHIDMERLEREIGRLLSFYRSRKDSQLFVLYGGACSPSIDKVVSKYGAVRVDAGNCLEALLGPFKTKAEAEGAFVLTPGWIRAWPSIMEAMGWDEVDVRVNLGRYSKAVIYDARVEPLTEEEILWFFDLTGLYVEVQDLDLSFFRRLMTRFLCSDQTEKVL